MTRFYPREKLTQLIVGLVMTASPAVVPAAQAQRICGTPSAEEWQAQLNPAQQQAYQRAEARAAQRQQEAAAGTAARTAAGGVTIPVVVHVVYNTAAQNVTDAQIQAQIDVLNRDYSRTNPDAVNTPAAFAGRTAAVGVQFRLAVRDPKGAATNGIERRQTTAAYWLGDRVKMSSFGGLDAWPAGQYLNLWVCNLDAGMLGYAQLPGGEPAFDGVVLLYSTLPGGAAPYNLGRTATHEVGHWLNLSHIFQGGCRGTDNVDDTPPQSAANYGCPTFPRTSCGAAGANGDMFMNFMDYVDDACMNSFTAGQRLRVQTLFEANGLRSSLLASPGLTPVATPLPVTLVEFGATARATAVQLHWTTAQEKNNAYFALERAHDGQHFAEVSRLTGSGTSSTARRYTYTDATLPAAVTLYYRLRQVDLDGTTTYSEVRTVNRPEQHEAFQVLPTLVADGQLRYTAAEAGQLECCSVSGQRVLPAVQLPAGTGQLDVRHLRSGTYFARLTSQAGVRVSRFVVE
ncbi:M43 family zinc metalloprotease [Hymenobacter sp. CRA2]|uniref:M43 family zinc metalloprotease n=1 Tax=Hymenobacter sp. CRA2 TaxID=1955620 RepID=UPI00098FD896|nr:M43 family zinc metalloprotease [Hymenobacter sp. CRA2]OON68746.1 hypothetical protein B0919_11185 [Hymenobacter sp. CRA2]